MTDKAFSFLTELSESRLFPTEKSLSKLDVEEKAELAYLYIIAIRILLHEDDSKALIQRYCRKVLSHGDFKRWQTDGNDLYCLLHSLVEDDYLSPYSIITWLRDVSSNHEHEDRSHRFFVRLDALFKINNSSMKAIRRLVTDWPDLSGHEKKLAVTRLLQFLRSRSSHGEILPMLSKLASHHNLEIEGARNLEDDDYEEKHAPTKKPKKPISFMAGLAGALTGFGVAKALTKENATAGATGAASIATSVGGLGAGFNPNGHKGIYQNAKPMIIRRNPKKTK